MPRKRRHTNSLATTVSALALLLTANACSTSHHADSAARDTPSTARMIVDGRCPVTTHVHDVAISADNHFDYGRDGLFTDLWPNGRLYAGGGFASRAPNGAITAKLAWWRTTPGTLRVTGTRIDHTSRPLLVDVPYGYGERGFQPTGITFPAPGCWRVQGTLGGVTTAFVVQVMGTPQPNAPPPFHITLPKPHTRWDDLMAISITTNHRFHLPLWWAVLDAHGTVRARKWFGDHQGRGQLTLNLRYHVKHPQHGSVEVRDPETGYTATVPVKLTPRPAPTE